jgi:hypothetical protein
MKKLLVILIAGFVLAMSQGLMEVSGGDDEVPGGDDEGAPL